MEAAKKKKLDDKAAKNVQTALEKTQISKCKTALSASNLLPKKKPRKSENNKIPVIKLKSEPEPISKVNTPSED